MKYYKKVLTIAGSDSGGGAGIQADIKTIIATGCYATTAITSLTAQNTMGVQAIFDVESYFVKKQIVSVLEDIGTDTIKIGMLNNSQIINIVVQTLQNYKKNPIILDPVMIATSGDPLINKSAILTLKEKLLPLSYLITPNILEAECLCQNEIKTKKDVENSCDIIQKMGARNVLIKGGHSHILKACDCLYLGDEKKHIWFDSEIIKTNNTHGTGCTLSSAIASYLAQNQTLIEAVKNAKNYIYNAIKEGQHYKLGNGNGPVFHPLFW